VAQALQNVPRPRALVTTPFHLKTLLLSGLELPPVDLLLYRAAGRNLAAIDALYNYLESYLGSDSSRLEFAAETAKAATRPALPAAAE